MILALATAALAAAPPSETLLAPADRVPLAAFAPLEGFGDGGGLDAGAIAGKVAVINAWYEW